jgi:hypothetical protein
MKSAYRRLREFSKMIKNDLARLFIPEIIFEESRKKIYGFH